MRETLLDWKTQVCVCAHVHVRVYIHIYVSVHKGDVVMSS